MTDKQVRFANEYIVDLNATQAAIRAGYASNSAKEQGCQLLTDDAVSALITDLKRKQFERIEITADKVLKEYAKIAFMDIREYYDANGRLLLPHDLSDAAAASLSGIDIDEIYGFVAGDKEKIGETKKIKLHNKLAALDSLGKHLGIFEKDNDQKKSQIQITIANEDAKLGE